MTNQSTWSHAMAFPDTLKKPGFHPQSRAYNAGRIRRTRRVCEADRQVGRPASKTESRWCSMMTALLVVWGAGTVALILLLIYRGTLTMHEDDQLFLDSAEDHMQNEQVELLSKIDRLTPWERICGAGSAVLLVVLAGVYLFTHMTQ